VDDEACVSQYKATSLLEIAHSLDHGSSGALPQFSDMNGAKPFQVSSC